MFQVNLIAVATTLATAFLSVPLAAEPFAYISNQLGDSVSVIDTKTRQVVDTIAVPGKPAGVAVSADGNTVYISTPEAKGIAVIDAKTHKLIRQVPVSNGSLGITADHAG